MADTNAALILPAAPASAAAGVASGTNTADIRGIKGPIHIPNSYLWIAWMVGAFIAALVLWRLWQKLRRRKTAAKPAVVIPPHRRAKDQLRNASELMSDPYAFCSLVSNVIRTYIEERFDLHAPDRTTEEFLEELRTTSALHVDHKRLLEDFLTRCDLVKFARHEPSHPELQALLDAALRFIDETSLVPAQNTPEPVSQAA